MFPQSWMPQDVQRRLIKYLLSQLSIFNEDSINKLNIDLGRTTYLSDIHLNTDVMSIPSLYYVRSAIVKTIKISIPNNFFINPIEIEFDSVSMTVSLDNNSDIYSSVELARNLVSSLSFGNKSSKRDSNKKYDKKKKIHSEDIFGEPDLLAKSFMEEEKELFDRLTSNMPGGFTFSSTSNKSDSTNKNITHNSHSIEKNNQESLRENNYPTTYEEKGDSDSDLNDLFGLNGGISMRPMISSLITKLLNQLHISIINISIRALFEDSILNLLIEKINFGTEKGSLRRLSLNNLFLYDISLNERVKKYDNFDSPTVGSKQTKDPEFNFLNKADNSLSTSFSVDQTSEFSYSSEEEIYEEKEESDDTEDEGENNDIFNTSELTNSFHTSKKYDKSCLGQSYMFSKEEASTLYMSAMPETIKGDPLENKNDSESHEELDSVYNKKKIGLVHIDHITLEVIGFLESVSFNMNNVKLSLPSNSVNIISPIVDFLMKVFSDNTTENTRNEQHIKSKSNRDSLANNNSDSINNIDSNKKFSTDIKLNFKINDFYFAFFTFIEKNGDFNDNSTLTFHVANISGDGIYHSNKKFPLDLSTKISVFNFKLGRKIILDFLGKNENSTDISIEYADDSLLIESSKRIVINFDEDIIINFLNLINQLLNLQSSLLSIIDMHGFSENKISTQRSGSLNIALNFQEGLYINGIIEKIRLKITTAPIIYTDMEFTIKKILVSCSECSLGFKDFRIFFPYKKLFEDKKAAKDLGLETHKFNTLVKINVSSLILKLNKNDAKLLKFFDSLNQIISSQTFLSADQNMSSSTLTIRKNYNLDNFSPLNIFIFKFDKISLETYIEPLKNIKVKILTSELTYFGEDKFSFKCFEFLLERDPLENPDILGSKKFIYKAIKSTNYSPMIIAYYLKNNLIINLYYAIIEYYGDLLTLLSSESNTVDSNLVLNNINNDEKRDNKYETKKIATNIIIYLTDCAFGLTPIALPSKAIVAIDGASLNAKLTEPYLEFLFEFKISGANLLLIDDIKNLEMESDSDGIVLKEDLLKDRKPATKSGNMLMSLFDLYSNIGYVSVCTLSNFFVEINVDLKSIISTTHILLKDNILILETCADSLQTLLALINALKPSVVLDNNLRYKTSTDKSIDVFANIENNFFGPQNFIGNQNSKISPSGFSNSDDIISSSSCSSSASCLTDHIKKVDRPIIKNNTYSSTIEVVESYYGSSESNTNNKSIYNINSAPEELNTDYLLDEDFDLIAARAAPVQDSIMDNESSSTCLNENKSTKCFSILDKKSISNSKIDPSTGDNVTNLAIEMTEDHFNNDKNISDSISYQLNEVSTINRILQLKADLRNINLIWNMYDGYDWEYTRETIRNALTKFRAKATREFQKRSDMNESHAFKNHESNLKNDSSNKQLNDEVLFNSIYINIPADRDPKNLDKDISRALNGDSEDISAIPISNPSFNSYPSKVRSSNSIKRKSRKGELNLKRSKSYKMQMEFKGVNLNFWLYAPNTKDYLVNRIDIRIQDLEIIDNVPTSTWLRFVTYMKSAGLRAKGQDIIHIKLYTVKPVPELDNIELIIKANVLPLRMHVDQDTLDFMVRFFQFKDDRIISITPPGEPFIQKLEVNSVKLKLDYKPKKVDYASLRSGYTTEFMNFFILDEAEMILRAVTLYGILGFNRMSKMLNDIWAPDIRTTQLGSILAGVGPIRSVVKLSGGVRDLVLVPVQEYKKDGRIVRSVKKGAEIFAKTSSNELVRLGTKLAVGTQNWLVGVEQLFSDNPFDEGALRTGTEDDDFLMDAEEYDIDSELNLSGARRLGVVRSRQKEVNHNVSQYARQPLTIQQGLSRAYESLGKNFSVAKDVLISLPDDASETGTAQGALVAVAKAMPVVMIRPMIGATQAVSNTLMGVANTIDPKQREYNMDKYKRSLNLSWFYNGIMRRIEWLFDYIGL